MKPFLPVRLPHNRINYAEPKLITALGKANREIAHSDALLARSRGAHLLVAPLARREAVSSSRIEGSQSTLNEVLLFERDKKVAGGEKRDDLSEIRNYAFALKAGAEELKGRQFSLNLLKALHGILLGRGTVRGGKKRPGAFRNQDVWVGRIGASKNEATYLPPELIWVNELMENWEAYYHQDAPDFLVQTAILHAQFELIHPFEDGNGRLGRLLIPLFLHNKKVLSSPTFYLSAYLEKNRDEYIETLRRLNHHPGDWDGWVLFFLRAVHDQARENVKTVKAILSLYEELKKQILNLTHSQFAVPILDATFQSLMFTRRDIVRHLEKHEHPVPSEPRAHALLAKLVEHKIIDVIFEGSGQRGTIYILTRLMKLLGN